MSKLNKVEVVLPNSFQEEYYKTYVSPTYTLDQLKKSITAYFNIPSVQNGRCILHNRNGQIYPTHPNQTVISVWPNQLYFQVRTPTIKPLNHADNNHVTKQHSNDLTAKLSQIFFMYAIQGCFNTNNLKTTTIRLKKNYLKLLLNKSGVYQLGPNKLIYIDAKIVLAFKTVSRQEVGLNFVDFLDVLADLAIEFFPEKSAENSFRSLVNVYILKNVSMWGETQEEEHSWNLQDELVLRVLQLPIFNQFQASLKELMLCYNLKRRNVGKNCITANYFTFLKLLTGFKITEVPLTQIEVSRCFIRSCFHGRFNVEVYCDCLKCNVVHKGNGAQQSVAFCENPSLTLNGLMRALGYISFIVISKYCKMFKFLTDDLNNTGFGTLALKALFKIFSDSLLSFALTRVETQAMQSFLQKVRNMWKEDMFCDYIFELDRRIESNANTPLASGQFSFGRSKSVQNNTKSIDSKCIADNVFSSNHIAKSYLPSIINADMLYDKVLSFILNFDENNLSSFSLAQSNPIETCSSWGEVLHNGIQNWVDAGEEFNLLIKVTSPIETKLNLLIRFGCSLSAFASQIIEHNYPVSIKRMNHFQTTNVSISSINTKKGRFPKRFALNNELAIAIALESFSLSSVKFSHAASIYSENSENFLQQSTEHQERHIEAIYHWANTICAHAETLSSVCGYKGSDYSTAEALEKEILKYDTENKENIYQQHNFGRTEYRLFLDSTKVGLLLLEAMKRFLYVVRMKPKWIGAWNDLSYSEFKLALQLPRGCMAAKWLFERSLEHAEKGASLNSSRIEFSNAIKIISAQFLVNHRFFKSNIHESKEDDYGPDAVSPLYRLLLARIFKDNAFSTEEILCESDMNRINELCGRHKVSEETLAWIFSTFESKSNGLTENGLIQYFCYIAHHDPVAFVDILNCLTGKNCAESEQAVGCSSVRLSDIWRNKKVDQLYNSTSNTEDVALNESKQPIVEKDFSFNFIEYFVVLGGDSPSPNCDLSNTNSVGDLEFLATIINCLPDCSSSHTPFPDEISKFCFPHGLFLSESRRDPFFFDTVLTDIKGQALYVTCLYFDEEKSPLEVLSLFSGNDQGSCLRLPTWINLFDIEQGRSKWQCFSPKCLCFISHFPYLSTFKKLLHQIYRLSQSTPPIPLECYIYNILRQVPPPSTESPFYVTIKVANKTFTMHPPQVACITPMLELSFAPLFSCLSCENILKVHLCILTERKIVICSSNSSILTPIAEAFKLLLYPFEFQTVYIPVLPRALNEFLFAPVPFLMGISSSLSDFKAMSIGGIVFVDLDNDNVYLPKGNYIPSIPESKMKKLLQNLRKTFPSLKNADKDLENCLLDSCKIDDDFGIQEDDPPISTSDYSTIQSTAETQIRLHFLNFHIGLFKNYQKYMGIKAQNDDSSSEDSFNKKAFIRDHSSGKEFYQLFFQTQIFQKFIEESFNKSEASLFFNKAIASKANMPKYPSRKECFLLNQVVQNSDSVRMVIVPLPHRQCVNRQLVRLGNGKFPDLDPLYFCADFAPAQNAGTTITSSTGLVHSMTSKGMNKINNQVEGSNKKRVSNRPSVIGQLMRTARIQVEENRRLTDFIVRDIVHEMISDLDVSIESLVTNDLHRS